MAKKRETDTSRLVEAMRAARQSLLRYRTERREMVRQFVGKHWSDEGSAERVNLNLLSLYVNVVGRNLIAKNPRVLLSTFDRGVKPTVAAMQTWANKEIERTYLASTLSRVVTDALFSIGIAKVALAAPAQAAHLGWSQGAGQPFCQRVDLDDFVFDVHARDFHEVSFIGHRYRVPLDAVRDSRVYGPARKKLEPTEDKDYNDEGDERISLLGRSQHAGSNEEFEDMVDLWEVYLPRERTILTLALDSGLTEPRTDGGVEPLREQGWLGPECGPYHILAFGVVPGNAMPKAPIMDLVDLHEAVNRSLRKVIKTAERSKEVTGVQGGALEDGSRIMEANDGDILRVDRPELIKNFITAGMGLAQQTAVMTELKNLFSWAAGNIDMMGGLSPQSKTATQDQLLAQNASKAIADMQDRTLDFTASTIKALCWYWWHDPFLTQKSSYSLPGLPGVSMTRQVTPQMRRQGRFEDLDIRVDPYSLRHQSPQERLQGLNTILETIVLPMMPILQQQGITIDLHRTLQKMGEYMDMPELPELLTIQEPPRPETETSGAGEDAARMPATTQRTYTRESRSSQTPQATDRNRVTSLFGINPGGSPNQQQNGMVR